MPERLAGPVAVSVRSSGPAVPPCSLTTFLTSVRDASHVTVFRTVNRFVDGEFGPVWEGRLDRCPVGCRDPATAEGAGVGDGGRIRITRKTLLELPDPGAPVPPPAKLQDHPAYHQIMAVFATADAPLRARAVCEAMDVEIASNNINNVRLKLKRLAERGILVETEQGLLTQPRSWPPSEPAARPLASSERTTPAPTSHSAF